MIKTVKACPHCGMIAQVHCWHPESDEVPTIEMPVDRAIGLSMDAISGIHDEMTRNLENLQSLILIRNIKELPDLLTAAHEVLDHVTPVTEPAAERLAKLRLAVDAMEKAHE